MESVTLPNGPLVAVNLLQIIQVDRSRTQTIADAALMGYQHRRRDWPVTATPPHLMPDSRSTSAWIKGYLHKELVRRPSALSGPSDIALYSTFPAARRLPSSSGLADGFMNPTCDRDEHSIDSAVGLQPDGQESKHPIHVCGFDKSSSYRRAACMQPSP